MFWFLIGRIKAKESLQWLANVAVAWRVDLFPALSFSIKDNKLFRFPINDSLPVSCTY